MACNMELRESGKPYPRTCMDCKLGPCHKLGANPVQTLVTAQPRIAELEAEVARLTEELKWTRDRLKEEGERVNALGLSIAGFTTELEIETEAAWNDAIEAAAHLVECDGDALGGKAGAAKAIRTLKRGEPV